MEIHKIDDITYSIEDGFVRSFLLLGKAKALLVDTNASGDEALDIASGVTDLPIELVNTHADKDHVAGNCRFDSFYMSLSEAANYYNCAGGKGKIIPLEDGEILDLGDRKIEVITVPGHTPGSLALLDPSTGYLFSGDIIQDGEIFMFGVMREINSYRQSLEKVLTFTGRFDLIFPSHGTCPLDADFLPQLIKKTDELMAGKIEGKPHNVHGMEVKCYDVGIARFLMQ